MLKVKIIYLFITKERYIFSISALSGVQRRMVWNRGRLDNW